ncbi:MAG: tetratricopeptide repeat protein, partial [bacterium]|nr:tetratricopeptide repeat protein [bacterium]
MRNLSLILLIILNLTILSNVNQVSAQEKNTIDSLLNCLETATDVTSKVDILNDLSSKHQRSNPVKAEELALQALRFSEKIGYKNGIANSCKFIGIINSMKRNFDKSIDYCQKSLEINNAIGNKRGISDCLIIIGIVYIQQSKYNNAIEYFQKSMKIKEEIEDYRGILHCLTNIGIIHKNLGNYDKAIKYNKKAL